LIVFLYFVQKYVVYGLYDNEMPEGIWYL